MRFYILLVALVWLSQTPAAAQDDLCSNGRLKGVYGLRTTGAVISVGDLAAIGRFVFDGNGNLTGTLFVRVNANVNKLTITGTYSVAADCTVSDTWYLSNGAVSTHQSVLVNNGLEYFIVNTSAEPSVISGEGKKQFTGD
jgi:hypothetical protein